MRIEEFRSQFPEYADLPDDEVLDVIGGEEIEEAPEPEIMCAPGIESELCGIAEQLKKIVAHIGKEKKEKPEKESAELLALGLQLQNIEAAIKSVVLPDFPSIEFPQPQQVVAFSVKRDEFNNIVKLIPEYKGV